MTTGVVTFNQAQWAAAYPELAAAVTNAQPYFDRATLILSNTANSRVQDVDRRRTLLYLLTAHIAYLTAPGLPRAGVPIVGRISSATQGSVTVGSELTMPQNAAWYAQSPYGLTYWQATKWLRSARYVPAAQPVFDQLPPFASPYRVT